MELLTVIALWVAGIGLVSLLTYIGLGIVVIDENEVGIVTKKFSKNNLPSGRIIATNGESGVQADTLSPGWHFFNWTWQYNISKQPLVKIPPGKIGVVVAIDGQTIPSTSILGKLVDCSNFQDARSFLQNGGQKGKQLGILTSGNYRINTALFNITPADVTYIAPGSIAIATTQDGAPLEGNEIAGETIPGHDNFQNPQEFLKNGGKRGLQEQLILSGQWNLNPWFVQVETISMTNIPIGYVGVVTSYIGKEHVDVSGETFKHGDLVEKGHKGVWETSLTPGLYPINTKTTKLDLIPTTNVVLNWAANRNESHQLDKNLSSIAVRSLDGFSYNLDVSVIIHVGAKQASRVISRMGSMQNLISQVLEPAIANYFRNSAQSYSALDFLKKRTEMQQQAALFVRDALNEYDIEAVDTLIGDIVIPPALLETQTQRKIAEEMQKTYEVQESSQKQKESLNRQAAMTEIQTKLVSSEQEVRISQLQAEQKTRAAEGETKVTEQKSIQMLRLAQANADSLVLQSTAESDAMKRRAEGEAALISLKAKAEAEGIEAKGNAQATAYKQGVDAMGGSNFTLLETMGIIGREKVKVIPDLVVGGGQDGSQPGMGLFNVLMAEMVKDKMTSNKTDKGLN